MAKGHTSKEIVGYYCVIPLKAAAARLVEAGELNGTDFTSEHIAQPHSQHRFIYIGGVAGVDRRAKAAALYFLKARIQEEAENGAEIAYTRPVTPDGLRVARDHEFEPVRGQMGPELRRVYMRQLGS